MIGQLSHSLGRLVGTGTAVIESRLGAAGGGARNPSAERHRPAPGEDDPGGGGPAAVADDPAVDDGELLATSVLTAAAGWVVKKTLRPRRVSWPRVVVAGIGATVLADLVGRALGPDTPDRDRAYEDDPDALLIRVAAGIAMAAGYASVLYPRLPGSPLTRGLIFGAMEIAAAPHGGLVRVATDTPGLRFPLKDLAVPIDEDAGPLANLAFGIGLGLLYRPRDRAQRSGLRP